MEKQQCCIARRDTGEKVFVPLTELEATVQALLKEVHDLSLIHISFLLLSILYHRKCNL